MHLNDLCYNYSFYICHLTESIKAEHICMSSKHMAVLSVGRHICSHMIM